MDISLVIPAYNESDNLPELLVSVEQLVLSAACAVEVIVVNDGSTDATGELLTREQQQRPWLTVVTAETNHGMGAALLQGTAHAANPIIVWVMADCSDRLEDVWEMRRKVMDGADLVIASRAATGGDYGELRGMKSWGSHSYSTFTRLLLDLPVHDITNAFRAFRRSLVDELELKATDFSISPEMAIKARANGKRVEEVPTVYSFRKKGLSNFAVLRMGMIYLRLTLRYFFIRLGGFWSPR